VSNRVLYNAQKMVIEEVKNELLKRTESERQRNVVKEVCNTVARKHRFDDMNGCIGLKNHLKGGEKTMKETKVVKCKNCGGKGVVPLGPGVKGLGKCPACGGTGKTSK